MKHQFFNNIKFTRDEKTGYYLNSTLRKRIHVYVWEYYNGAIPKGYEVHHRDKNKSNNDISNLELLTSSEHKKLHASELTEEQRKWKRENLRNNAQPKATEWHKSEKGINWHKSHYQKYKEALHQNKEIVCENCGKVFLAEKGKFCCNACKSAYRRKQGKDLTTCKCVICGNEFLSNKYHKAKTCSRACANKMNWRNKHESKES